MSAVTRGVWFAGDFKNERNPSHCDVGQALRARHANGEECWQVVRRHGRDFIRGNAGAVTAVLPEARVMPRLRDLVRPPASSGRAGEIDTATGGTSKHPAGWGRQAAVQAEAAGLGVAPENTFRLNGLGVSSGRR